MKVYDKPYTFINGDVLDPHDINDVWRYKQEALADASARRYIESVVPLSFVRTSQTAYVYTDTAAVRTYSFTPPDDVYVTRAFLVATLSSIAADVNITLKANGTTVPTGCTDPWLTIASDADTGQEIRDLNPARFKLEGGTRYEITLESTGAFVATQFDVTFHIVSDRFGFDSANEPDFQPTLVSEDIGLVEAIQDANETNFATEVAKLGVGSYAPVTYCLHNVSSDNTFTDERTFRIPRIDNDRAPATIKRASMWVGFDANVNTIFTIEIVDEGSSVVAGSTFPVPTSTFGYKDLTGLSISLSASGSGLAADSGEDYAVRFKTSTSLTVHKAFIVLWIQ